MQSADVTVIGAGITGVAAAYELARAGHRVVVLEAHGPAAMASGWTLAGVRQSGRHPAELPLARRAVERWATLADELGAPTAYRRAGNLRLARSEAEIETIRALVDDQRRRGLELRFLDDRAAIRALAPALSERVLAASFCPTDGHADPHATVDAYRRAAERSGAVFRFGERVHAVETTAGAVTAVRTADARIATAACVVAPGIHVNELLAPLGHRLPLTVPMVTVVQTEPLPATLAPVLGVANADCAARQQVDGRLRVTSGAQPWHERLVAEADGRPRVPVTTRSLATTIETVSAVLPVFADVPVAAVWAGLLDLTPDALPVIDRVPDVDGLVVAAGFSGHGFGIGPVTGELVADLVTGTAPRLPLDAFRLDRFATPPDVAPAAATLHG